jgi:hypothetical protein
LASHAFGGFGGWRLNEYEQRLSAAQRTFDAALLTLRLFDAEHSVEANYEIPILDREAVIRDAREKHTQGIAAIRARYEKPARQTAEISSPAFVPLPDTEDYPYDDRKSA